MGILKKIGIIGSNSITASKFESLFEHKSFYEIEYDKPSDYVSLYWNKFKETQNNASVNGKMFEIILQTLMLREGIFPLYLQAQVAFVPNVNYDSLLYCKEFGPISLSMKTSLRERYKQADLEAIALKYVHRKAKCYLLTVSGEESKGVKEKILTGEVIGIDKVILCTNNEIDQLIKELKSYKLTEAGSVDIISSSQKITEKVYKTALQI